MAEWCCKAMKTRCQVGNPDQKGIVALEVRNRQTGDMKQELIAYRRGARGRPLLLNFCPWCGKKLEAEVT